MEPKMEKEKLAHFGIIGLNEQSKSILLSMHDRGYHGCVYDFTNAIVEDFIEDEAKDKNIFGVKSLEQLTKKLAAPRCIVLMVEDLMIQDFVGIGLTVDDFIELEMLPHLSYQDYVLDVVNRGSEDLEKRVNDLMSVGIRYMSIKETALAALLQGLCISLENQQLWTAYDKKIRPSMYKEMKKSMAELSARTGTYAQSFGYLSDPSLPMPQRLALLDTPHVDDAVDKKDANSCCHWGTPGSKQSYIESTINEISRNNNIVIREAGQILTKIVSLKNQQLCNVFQEWCKGDLNSETCKNRGYNSKPETATLNEEQQSFVDQMTKALLACHVINFARGLATLREVAEIHQWDIDFAGLRLAWPRHYHYKCGFYRKVKVAFTKNPQLTNLLLDENFAKVVNEGLESLKEVIAKAKEVMNTIEKMSVRVYDFSFDGLEDALEYYEDFVARKLLCAKLFERQLENEEAMEELDLSPIYKYQHQLREQQSLFESIEKSIKKVEEKNEFSGSNMPKYLSLGLARSDLKVQDKIAILHDDLEPNYKTCMKHLEKDEKVTPLHISILMKKIEHVKDFSKDYLPNARQAYRPRLSALDYDR